MEVPLPPPFKYLTWCHLVYLRFDLRAVHHYELDLVVADAALLGGDLAVQLKHALLDLLKRNVHPLQHTGGWKEIIQ